MLLLNTNDDSIRFLTNKLLNWIAAESKLSVGLIPSGAEETCNTVAASPKQSPTASEIICKLDTNILPILPWEVRVAEWLANAESEFSDDDVVDHSSFPVNDENIIGPPAKRVTFKIVKKAKDNWPSFADLLNVASPTQTNYFSCHSSVEHESVRVFSINFYLHI